MQKIVALLLACWMLGSSLLPGFSVDVLAHRSELMRHYQQHREANPTLSFDDFLKMHYGAGSEHQKHPKHSHRNLPGSVHSASASVPNAFHLITPDPIQVLIRSKLVFSSKDDLYAYLAIFALINPPRQ